MSSVRMIPPIPVDNAVLQASTVPEDDHPAYDPAVTYAKGDLVIITGETHRIYSSLKDANTGNDPLEAESEWWFEEQWTNRWRVFDAYIGDPTVQNESASWTFSVAQLLDSVALFGLDASSVTITVTTATGVEVYNETHSLQDESGVVDAYTYFFSPIIRRDRLVVTDIPPHAGATVTVAVNAPGGTVTVGQLALGLAEVLGRAIDQVGLGIEDFSEKSRNTFGGYDIVERDAADLLNFTFVYLTSKAAYLRSKLKTRRATFTIYTADSRYRANDYAAYGLFESFQTLAQNTEHSEGTIEVESIT